jgi:hypothetical protein
MRDAGMLQAGPHFHGFGAAADVEVLRRSLDAAAGKTLPP